MDDPVKGKYIRVFFLFLSLSSLSLLHHGNAIRREEVNSFAYIVTLREATVVSFEKSADVVSRILVSLVDWNSMIYELKGIHHKCNAIEQCFLIVFKTVGLFYVFIKFLFIRARDHIPCLSSTLVVVIKGIDPQVLNVPAESRELHTHVNPGVSDP